jgi:Ran GTPase-activating protein (RanGAP) involved in mRNA processing and transport
MGGLHNRLPANINSHPDRFLMSNFPLSLQRGASIDTADTTNTQGAMGTPDPGARKRIEELQGLLKNGSVDSLRDLLGRWPTSSLEFRGLPAKEMGKLLCALEGNTRIRRLTFNVCDVAASFGSQCAELFKRNKTLVYLGLQKCEVGSSDLARAFGALPESSLKHLSLASCGLKENDVLALAYAIIGAPNLQSLDVSGNQFSAKSFQALAIGVRESKLLYLNLSSCSTACPEGLSPFLTDVVGSAPLMLSTLRLQQNKVGTGAPNLIVQMLQHCPSLTKLDLIHNEIDADFLNSLKPALSAHPSLAVLMLGHNEICDRGAGLLADVVASNASLRQIWIGGNAIGQKGVKSLAVMLSGNPKITHLDLSFNFVDDQGAEFLAKALPSNENLRYLNLRMCHFDPPGFGFISKMLPKNRTLLHLLFDAHRANREDAANINEYILRNLTFVNPVLRDRIVGASRGVLGQQLGHASFDMGVHVAHHLIEDGYGHTGLKMAVVNKATWVAAKQAENEGKAAREARRMQVPAAKTDDA